MKWAAAVERVHVVNDPAVAINERGVQRIVGVLLAARPEIDVGGSDPQAVGADGAGNRGFTPANETLACWRLGRELTGCRQRVIRRDVKGHQRSTGLAGN